MKLKRLLAGVLSAAMMLSVGSALAFAVDEEDTTADTAVNGIAFTSSMTIGESADIAYVPEVTYTYTLSEVATGDQKALTVTTVTTTTDGTFTSKVAVNYGTISSTAGALSSVLVFSENTVGPVTSGETYTKDGEIWVSLDALNITEPGFYVYELTATASVTDTLQADFFSNDTQPRYVYLQVSYVDNENEDETDVDLAITDYKIYTDLVDAEDDNSTYKCDGYDNTYGTDGLLTFRVTAYKFGSFASANQAFTYTVTATNASEGDTFVVYDVDATTPIYLVADSNLVLSDDDGDAYEFTMKATDSFSIAGLVPGQKFTVTIFDEDNLGYFNQFRVLGTSWWNMDIESITENGVSRDYTMLAVGEAIEDSEKVYATATQGLDFATVFGSELTSDDDNENIQYFDVNLPDTGVILEFAPFALMVLAAGAFISLRAITAVRKNEE